MDADTHNDLQTNKYAPLLSILYDENKIDVFRGEGYSEKLTLVVEEWQKLLPNGQGYIRFLPYSDFLVTAK